MSDEEAVRRVQEGDREAFRSLVNRYAPLVFHALRQRGCAEQEVDDLAQDVFLKAYEGMTDFRGGAAFSSWIYQIALNLATDRLRRQSRRLEVSGTGEIADLAAVAMPVHSLEDAELAASYRNALARLSDDYAEPFRLRYDEELSYDEIADRLGISPGALRVRIHRARLELRTHLAGIL